MATYRIEPDESTLHGYFSCDLPPVLTIDPGDTVIYRTLDAAWGLIDQPDPFIAPQKFQRRNLPRDRGHALCGPIAIRGAKAGMTLGITIKRIRPGRWGWSSGGGFPSPLNVRLGLADGPEYVLRWALDTDQMLARSQFGHTISMRPFMGIMGMPPNEPGVHSTFPPRFCGGNLDCKDLVAGSQLFLPIPVEGGLFSLGDGHAVQGDGEVAGPALECPMEHVEVVLNLHDEMQVAMPRARTPSGWLTFGVHTDLDEALVLALEGVIELMQRLHGFTRKEALVMASLAVDFRVTQAVNGTKGIHAVLHDGVFNARAIGP